MIDEKEKQYLETLERFIDEQGLSKLLGDIATLCGEKADHVATNWQDYELSELWNENGEKIQECSESINDPKGA